MICVAFTLIGGKEWAGGRNYLLNLLSVLCHYEAASVQPVLFAGLDCSQAEIEPFERLQGLQLVRDAAFDRSRKRGAVARALIVGRDERASQVFRRFGIDVVFEAAQFFGWRLGLPAVAWIPDLQHRMLPHLFSRFAWLKRELGFRAQIFGSRTFMLSSDDARASCELFYPKTRGRTATVRFAIQPRAVPDLATAQNIARRYGLDGEFFFIPNQFWKHKNHLLVIEALALLRARRQRCVIAASGFQADPRFPDHFSAVLYRISELQLEENFRLLGVIPYDHIGALLRASTALCNPSLFEGWSTTVEEARLSGTPMLLSDLAVHQEQMGKDAVYFDRNSPASLADAIMKFPRGEDTARRAKLEQAQAEAGDRARAYAANFVELITSVVRGVSR